MGVASQSYPKHREFDRNKHNYRGQAGLPMDVTGRHHRPWLGTLARVPYIVLDWLLRALWECLRVLSRARSIIFKHADVSRAGGKHVHFPSKDALQVGAQVFYFL